MLQLPPEGTLRHQVSPEAKKLVSILATSKLVTETRKKIVETIEVVESARASKDREESKGKYLENLARVPCIRYPINFGKKPVLALFDSSDKFNAVYPAFAKELDLPIRATDVGAEKINCTILDTYEIVIAVFLVKNKANQVRFFKEIFLIVNVSLEVVFGMPFLILSGADIDFFGRELRWRIFTTKKALPTIIPIELIDKKEFAAAALDLEHEIYVVYIGSVSFDTLPSSSLLDVHPFWRP